MEQNTVPLDVFCTNDDNDNVNDDDDDGGDDDKTKVCLKPKTTAVCSLMIRPRYKLSLIKGFG